EFYNRVQPIVFCPLEISVMPELVDLRLNEVAELLKLTKKVTLKFDEAVKSFLAEYGYHPTLGARPLWNLIQKTVVANLSYVFIKENIEEGSEVTLFYDDKEDVWSVDVNSQHTPLPSKPKREEREKKSLPSTISPSPKEGAIQCNTEVS